MKKKFAWNPGATSVWMAFVLLFLLSCLPPSAQAAEVKNSVISAESVGDSAAAGTELPVTATCNEKGGVVIPDGQGLKSVSVNTVGGKAEVQSKTTAAAAECTSAFLYNGTAFCSINAASDADSALIILVAYTSSGRMCGIVTHEIQLSAGSSSYEFACNLSGDIYKAFLLSDTCAPLCAAKVAPAAAAVYTVTFADWDGTVLSKQKICDGESAVPPAEPERIGYRFTGWSGTYTQVRADCTVTAQYEEDTTPAIIVGTAAASASDEGVTVTVSVLHNPGILGMVLNLSYDDRVLTLKNAANGSAFGNSLTLTAPNHLVNGCSFVWDGVEITEENIHDGTILTLTFDVAENAPAGSYPVAVTFGGKGAVDNDLKPITMNVHNGSITVAE